MSDSRNGEESGAQAPPFAAPGEKESPVEALKCSACGGDLGKGTRVEGSGEDEEYIPIARCLSCGKEFDRHTQEYYEFFADTFLAGKDECLFRLGLRGALDDGEYEIIGRVRYQEEDDYEPSTWDEWLAVNTTDGTYHWFVEEEGEVYAFSEYVPQSINLEADGDSFEFDGANIKKNTAFAARIVYAEGELTWKPEIGEPVTMYEFKRSGTHYTVERSEDEVSVTAGKKISYKKVLMAFRRDDYLKQYENTVRIRKDHKRSSLVYLVMSLAAMVMIVRGCISGEEIKGVMSNKAILVENERIADEGKAYHSGVLYGPVELPKKDALYTVSVAVNSAVQPLRLEWQSFRLMLIREDHLQAGRANLKEFFDEIDLLEDPVESYVFQGDFWDEEGYDDEGHWHESDTSASKDFVLESPGRYYLFLDLFSEKPRRIDAIAVTASKDVQSYGYYIALFCVFAGLMIWKRHKAKTYNELPFVMSDE